MTSKPVASLLADLSVTKSHSLPHVADGNSFSEAQFKTRKYRPDFPARFGSEEQARAHCRDFFPWYNEENHHAGIGFFTPHDVHYGHAARPNQMMKRGYAMLRRLCLSGLAHSERTLRALGTIGRCAPGVCARQGACEEFAMAAVADLVLIRAILVILARQLASSARLDHISYPADETVQETSSFVGTCNRPWRQTRANATAGGILRLSDDRPCSASAIHAGATDGPHQSGSFAGITGYLPLTTGPANGCDGPLLNVIVGIGG